MTSSGPIGVFDSGVGGLTVLSALRAALPDEDFVYLGDTARLPYGPKSPETVAAYALQVAQRLMQDNIKMLVVACNTATAHGLAALRDRYPDLPILGVIEPGARAAAAATKNGRIVVWATEGTVRSRAYETALRAINPALEVEGVACNLLVALAEEGWTDGAEAEAVVRRYLAGVANAEYDTLVLGCTHFPILAPIIARLVPPGVRLVDSAQTTAYAAARMLVDHGLACDINEEGGSCRFLATDGLARFERMVGLFAPEMAGGEVGLTAL